MPSKQEEIKNGVIQRIRDHTVFNDTATTRDLVACKAATKAVLEYLDSAGCVLKVEGELPDIGTQWEGHYNVGAHNSTIVRNFIKASGYCLTEPLIGDE